MGDYSIYVVVRKDIAPGRKAAQVAHAVAGLVDSYNDLDGMKDAVYNGYLIVLEHDSALRNAALLANRMLPNYIFFEPDFGIHTASAYLVHESERWIFSSYKLAYPKRKWWKRERYNFY